MKEKKLKITPEFIQAEYKKFVKSGEGLNSGNMNGEAYCRLEWLRPYMKNTLIIWTKY